jgi:hypothetical protein
MTTVYERLATLESEHRQRQAALADRRTRLTALVQQRSDFAYQVDLGELPPERLVDADREIARVKAEIEDLDVLVEDLAARIRRIQAEGVPLADYHRRVEELHQVAAVAAADLQVAAEAMIAAVDAWTIHLKSAHRYRSVRSELERLSPQVGLPIPEGLGGPRTIPKPMDSYFTPHGPMIVRRYMERLTGVTYPLPDHLRTPTITPPMLVDPDAPMPGSTYAAALEEASRKAEALWGSLNVRRMVGGFNES